MSEEYYMVVAEFEENALNSLCGIVNNWATKKGWNESIDGMSHREIVKLKAEMLCLMHSELSECLEFLRKKVTPSCSVHGEFKEERTDIHGVRLCPVCLERMKMMANDDHVPSLTGEAAELADVLIRIFHYCGKFGIDIGEAVKLKHEYNTNRPFRHGKVS